MNKVVESLQMEIGMGGLRKAYRRLLQYLSNCKNEIPISVNEIREIRSELLLLSGNLEDIDKRFSQGLLAIQDYNLSKNRIRLAYLHLLDSINKYHVFYNFLENIEEEEAWDNATKQNTILSYEEYFSKYPKGKYISETEKIIQELKEELKRKAQEEKERRSIFRNFNIKKSKNNIGNSNDLYKEINTSTDWWDSLPDHWQKILLDEIGVFGKVSEKNVRRVLRLKIIDISNNRSVRDLISIKHLNKLKTLNLFNTSIQSLEGIETLNNLEELNIAQTNIGNLEPLLSLRNLKSLVYSSIPDKELSSLRKNCPMCIFKIKT